MQAARHPGPTPPISDPQSLSIQLDKAPQAASMGELRRYLGRALAHDPRVPDKFQKRGDPGAEETEETLETGNASRH